MVPLVRIGVECEVGNVERAGLEVLEVIVTDDIIWRGDAVAYMFAGPEVGPESRKR